MMAEHKRLLREWALMFAAFSAVGLILFPIVTHLATANAREAANDVRDEMRQRIVVAEAAHATYVTHSELAQLMRQIDAIHVQLGRIEERLAK